MSEQTFTVTQPLNTPPISISSTSTEVTHTGSWKYIWPTYHDRVAPCAAGCPTGIDVQGYMTMLRDGRIDDACDLVLRENPMPAITGRVCNHPCEAECNRDAFDGAVAIHAVERVLGDRILAQPAPVPIPVRHAERVAIIGSGPAGLACAYHLVRLGYHTEVFEEAERPGGMLRAGIPEFRLPRRVLDAQIEWLESLGVRFNCGFRFGGDVTLESLTNDFAAVFIATGAPISRSLNTEAAGRFNVRSGLDFLRAVNGGERPEIGKDVVVIGGGNTAIDCARTALRLGADVTVAYRRTRDEMPAIADEVADAEREGVQFAFLAAPSRVLPGEHGATIVFKRMMLAERGADGRRTVIKSSEPGFPLRADTILTAIGEDVEASVFPPELRDPAGRAPDEWGSTRVSNVFVGGDLAGGDRTVATALGHGKRAAIGIDRYLRICRGESFDEELIDELTIGGVGALSMARWLNDDPVRRVAPLNDVVEFEEINTSYFERVARHYEKHTTRAHDFTESNSGLSEDQALREAGRCFQCGVCNECELCLIYCGDVAIVRSSDSRARFEVRMDYCKGCGICAEECPRGAIVMTREGL